MKREEKTTKNIYNQPRYYTSFSDDFVKTKTVCSVVVDEKYKYIPKSKIVRFFRNCLYYIFAYPAVKIIDRIVDKLSSFIPNITSIINASIIP